MTIKKLVCEYKHKFSNNEKISLIQKRTNSSIIDVEINGQYIGLLTFSDLVKLANHEVNLILTEKE